MVCQACVVCLINSLRFVKFVYSLVVKGALRLLLLFFGGEGEDNKC